MRLFLATATLLVLASGCTLFQEKAPREARILIEGNSAAGLTLITSTSFQPEATAKTSDNGHRAIRLYRADTLQIVPPYNEAYDIRSTKRFFVRAIRANPGSDQLVLRIHIDGKEMYEFNSAQSTEQDSTLQYTFVYRD